MNFLRKIFGGKNRSGKFNTSSQVKQLFLGFSDIEKRELLKFNAVFLAGEKGRRAGKMVVLDLAGNQSLSLLQRLSDQELDSLIEIQEITRKADAKNGQKAIALYEKVLSLAPWDEISVMSIGVEYANAGNFDKAMEFLEKAITLNPNNKRVRSNLEEIKKAIHG